VSLAFKIRVKLLFFDPFGPSGALKKKKKKKKLGKKEKTASKRTHVARSLKAFSRNALADVIMHQL